MLERLNRKNIANRKKIAVLQLSADRERRRFVYEGFFRMKHTPFMANISSDILYISSTMEENLDWQEFVSRKQQLAVVTVDVGCEKVSRCGVLYQNWIRKGRLYSVFLIHNCLSAGLIKDCWISLGWNRSTIEAMPNIR